MGKIKDFLLGRKVTISDKKLGNLSTRIRNNPYKNYVWTSLHKLEGQKKESVFLLEGNMESPEKRQLDCVYEIVDSLDKIICQVDKTIKQQSNTKQEYNSNWSKEFYLDTVTLLRHRKNFFTV